MFDLIPFRRGDNDLSSLFDEMERNVFRNFGGHFPAFRADIVDKGDKYVLEADIPGFDKDEINIQIDDNRLTISAQKNIDKEETQENYIRRERRYGSFIRSFDVSDVKTEEITADYKNGVLTLVLPKKNTVSNSRRIDIH
ncbi:MAG: Hsp20/alpha crystallin family protein [Clostridia bacterium]|nr:Hsp20/alpha crystallin family protein [Clostridia bacterium]